MKFKHHVYLWSAGASMTTLIAILLSAKEQLLIISPWILDIMLAALGSLTLSGGFRVYVAARKHWLTMRAQENEIKAQEQQRRIESERWQVERAALLLNQQLQVSRIFPDARGFMPMLVNITDMGPQYVSLPHPIHQARISGAGQQPALPQRANSLTQGIPVKVRYEEVVSQIPAGHTLLGVSAQGIETKEFAALKTMLISGGSDSGKSNTLAIKIDEAMRLGRNTRLIVIDWHAYKPDSLTKKIKAYESRFLLPVVTEEEDTVPVLKGFLGKYQERRKAMKQAEEQGLEAVFDDILLVADEVPEMLDSGVPELKETLNQVAKICGRSARGFGLFGWFVCQNMIGAASIRNYAHTIIGHKAVMLNEQKMVANGHAEIIQDMDTWPRGRVVVYGQSFTGTQVLQMPIFTQRVVDSTPPAMEPLQPKVFIDSTISASQAESAFLSGGSNRNDETSSVSDDETNGEAELETGKIVAFRVSQSDISLSTKKETSGVSDETKKIILRMHRAGMPWREIARLVGLSGEKYGMFKQACQELDIQPGQATEA